MWSEEGDGAGVGGGGGGKGGGGLTCSVLRSTNHARNRRICMAAKEKDRQEGKRIGAGKKWRVE